MDTVSKLFGGSFTPSIIKDPFNMKYVERISLSMRRRIFDHNELVFEASVHFKNGNTEGTQNFTGENFEDLFRKVYNFCSTL